MTSSIFEDFERRLLLSAPAQSSEQYAEANTTGATQLSAAPVVQAENPDATTATAFDTTGTYSGVVKLRTRDELGRRIYVLKLTFSSRDAAGVLSGTLTGPDLSTTTFTDGRIGAAGGSGSTLSLTFAGDRTGSLTARSSARNPGRLDGSIKDASGKRLGTFRLHRMAAQVTPPATTSPSTGDSAGAAAAGPSATTFSHQTITSDAGTGGGVITIGNGVATGGGVAITDTAADKPGSSSGSGSLDISNAGNPVQQAQQAGSDVTKPGSPVQQAQQVASDITNPGSPNQQAQQSNADITSPGSPVQQAQQNNADITSPGSPVQQAQQSNADITGPGSPVQQAQQSNADITGPGSPVQQAQQAASDITGGSMISPGATTGGTNIVVTTSDGDTPVSGSIGGGSGGVSGLTITFSGSF